MFGKSIFIPQKDKYRRKCRSEVYLYRASGHRGQCVGPCSILALQQSAKLHSSPHNDSAHGLTRKHLCYFAS